MTPTPARLMRAQAEACPTRPRPTERERQKRAYILDAARRVFIAHGRFRTTLREFAAATGLTQNAIRNQVSDMDHLFALTLHKYLDEILVAVSAVPRDHPDLHRRRRAEYFRVTRGFLNVPTPIHFLWLRDRYSLPDDELESLEQAMHNIGYMLAGDAWQTALLLLDSPHLSEIEVQTMLAAHASRAEPAEAQETPAPVPEAAASPPRHNPCSVTHLLSLAPAKPPPQRAHHSKKKAVLF